MKEVLTVERVVLSTVKTLTVDACSTVDACLVLSPVSPRTPPPGAWNIPKMLVDCRTLVEQLQHLTCKGCLQVNDDGKSFFSNHAVDGNRHTRWSSDHKDGQWLTIKLDADSKPTCNVTEIRILWETAYGAEYTISTSKDMETFKKVHSTTRESRGAAFFCEGLVGRG